MGLFEFSANVFKLTLLISKLSSHLFSFSSNLLFLRQPLLHCISLFIHALKTFGIFAELICHFRLRVLCILQLFINFRNFFICLGDLEEWLDFCEKSPPLPISQLEVRQTVSLNDSDSTKLILLLGELLSGEVTTKNCLKFDHHITNLQVTIFFELSKNTC